MTRLSDFCLSTKVEQYTVQFFLTNKGIPYIRVWSSRPSSFITGARANALAKELVPVECWPQYATSLANNGESNQHERLF